MNILEIFELVNVAEIEGYDADERFICTSCECEITTDECYAECGGDTMCLGCYEDAADEYESEAPIQTKEALEMLKITCEFPLYDESQEYAPTREEFEAGFKEAYTPNAYRCHLRHECTNYDDVIRDLQRGEAIDQTIYKAVRDRVEEMIDAEIERTNNMQQ